MIEQHEAEFLARSHRSKHAAASFFPFESAEIIARTLATERVLRSANSPPKLDEVYMHGICLAPRQQAVHPLKRLLGSIAAGSEPKPPTNAMNVRIDRKNISSH